MSSKEERYQDRIEDLEETVSSGCSVLNLYSVHCRCDDWRG